MTRPSLSQRQCDLIQKLETTKNILDDYYEHFRRLPNASRFAELSTWMIRAQEAFQAVLDEQEAVLNES